MNIIVVGSSSPIGKSIVNRLSNRHKVTSVSRSSGDVIWDITSKSDLNLDGFEKFDVMINLVASQGGATYSKWVEAINVNEIGPVRLLDSAIRSNIKHFVQISTIFDSFDHGIYSVTKRHGDVLLDAGVKGRAIDLTILRPSRIYGSENYFRPNQPAFYSLLDQVFLNRSVVIKGARDVKRNFVHVDCLAGVIERVIDLRMSGVFNCQSLRETSFLEIVRVAKEVSGSSSKIVFDSTLDNIRDEIYSDRDSILSISGFELEVPLHYGIDLVWKKWKKM